MIGHRRALESRVYLAIRTAGERPRCCGGAHRHLNPTLANGLKSGSAAGYAWHTSGDAWEGGVEPCM